MENNNLDTELEQLMDSRSIFTILCSLERVCEEKASYVAGGGSHGDPSPYLAKQWRALARAIGAIQSKAAGL